MENTVGFWCYFFVQRDEACTLWLRRRCVVDSLQCRRFFVPYVLLVPLFTQLTSHTFDQGSRINDRSNCTAEFCGYPDLPWNRRETRIYRLALQSGVAQAYMGLLLLHLNFKKNFVGVVHRGNPPSPQVSYGVGLRCSLDCTSLGLRLYYSTRFGVWQLANCQKYKIIFCLQGRFCV